ncbi:Receptor kinase-like protein Xa21, partial [Linum grandiflorum]
HASTYGNNTDQLALTHFKSQITHDPLQITTSWNSTTHFCNWPGITCGRKHPRVPVLDLRSSGLSGSISPAIGNLSFLRKIYLQNNSLTGRIPPEIGRLSRLEFITLRNNSLSGEILPGVFNCSNLVFFTFAGNLLSGKIPDEIGSLSKLKRIGLDNNSLTGSIPESVGRNLTKLVEFHLETNHLQGSIPNTLGNCKRLLALNISQNSLDGSIPRKKQAQPSITSLPSTDILQVSYDTLFKATDGFSPANEIGRGGSGTVYKGILECPESIAVAVKVLNLVCHRGYKSFVAECEALRNARHRNLVKVVTVCSSVDHHGNDFKAIVYEFMENGSLDDWLHNNRGTSTNTSSLNMIRRLNIGIDVGLAIEYLHNGCETPIMHWDLKPSNVRLDHQMTGRVSDFGLAKLVAAAEGSGSATNQWSSVGVRGTVGYAPPEYGTGDEKSTKEDVYSYGILMLEMFTGKMGDLDLCTQHRRT